MDISFESNMVVGEVPEIGDQHLPMGLGQWTGFNLNGNGGQGHHRWWNRAVNNNVTAGIE